MFRIVSIMNKTHTGYADHILLLHMFVIISVYDILYTVYTNKRICVLPTPIILASGTYLGIPHTFRSFIWNSIKKKKKKKINYFTSIL